MRRGALVPNSDLAYFKRVRQRYPLLSSAILAGASAQLRNMASTGGNLLQRTRCLYFYDTNTARNKRELGSGCGALEGFNRMNAILGWSKSCIAVHPFGYVRGACRSGGDGAVTGPGGSRAIPFAEFHRLPRDMPEIDTNLAADEIIILRQQLHLSEDNGSSFLCLCPRFRRHRSELEGGAIKEARIALGGVAHKPWRVPGAEDRLKGQAAARKSFGATADAILDGAAGFAHNSFKIELARRAIIRALEQAAAGTPQSQSVKVIL